ncbi:unnamed protein product [Effrenium voratum]|nr:unnamed protein product [Effrenium voratum]
MAHRLAYLLCLRLAAGGWVEVLNVDPSAGCPADWQLDSGTSGAQVCVRSGFPGSSVQVDVVQALAQAGHVKGRRIYDSIAGTLQIYQKGSTDAFQQGTRDLSSVESSDYVDGMSVTIGAPRTHIFTLALGTSYDTALGTAGMCPCGVETQSVQCGGDPVPAFLSGEEHLCDSGTVGSASLAWGARLVSAGFGPTALGATTQTLEVRLMCDSVSSNEDVGVLQLSVSVNELEDTTPPVISLLGASPLKVEVDAIFQDPGASCVDDLDGPLTTNITVLGWVNTSELGTTELVYSCEDSRENAANVSRLVVVVDSGSPTVELLGEPRLCLVEGEAYMELGARCLDAADGAFMAEIRGLVDSNVLGDQYVSYVCVDSVGNNATTARRVTVVSGEAPGDLFLTSFGVEVRGALSFFAPQVPATDVDPKSEIVLTWSEPVTAGTEACRFISFFKEGELVAQHEALDLFANGALSAQQLVLGSQALEESTSYVVQVDEHLVLTAGLNGSQRQQLQIRTGDYQGPRLRSGPSGSAWPFGDLRLGFDEDVRLGSGSLLVWERVAGVEEEVPCNGSASERGARMEAAGSELSVQLGGLWSFCGDFRLSGDVGCALDAAENPSQNFSVAFLSSCVSTLSPEQGSRGVALDQPVTLTFPEPVALAPSNASVVLEIVGESVRRYGQEDWPRLYVLGRSLILDLACATKYCAIQAAYANLSFSPLGFCAELTPQQCKGKVHRVWLEGGLVLRNLTWPEAPEGLGVQDVPAQLVEEPYYFTLQVADYTAPRVLVMEVSASGVEVALKVRLDEAGVVYCAALGEADGECTQEVLLLQEYSNSTCNLTRSDCKDCEPPSYGCFTRSSMWADDGCSGRFLLEGVELDCQSWELDKTLHDAAFRSVLSLGHRHACAVRKDIQAAACWGKADYIDPVTFAAPAGSFGAVAAGYLHTCGLLETGEVQCWGTDLHGETSAPSGSYEHITSGFRFSCALRASDHSAVCWGLNDFGQASPPSAAFLTVSAGYKHACGIREDYLLACWGLDDLGQASPPAGEFLALSDRGQALAFGSLAAGWHHNCAVRRDQGISCWGDNSQGQCDVPVGEATYLQVAAGRVHSCGLFKVLPGQGPGVVKNGTLHCWGADDVGQSSPPQLPKVGGVAADDDYTCALAMDGTPYCWGKNDFGQASPSGSGYGLPDEFENVTCATDTTASSKRIKGAGLREASASARAAYDSARGHAEARLTLQGLAEGQSYGVYCTAEDEELPVPNVVSDSVVVALGRQVTMPDRTAPLVQVVSVDQGPAGSVALKVSLSEEGVAFCLAVVDGARAPSQAALRARGGRSEAGEVVLTGLALDVEYDGYCTARDLSGNWATQEAILQSKVDFHVARDLAPPKLLRTEPLGDGFCVCEADGVAPGCMTTLKLTFDEDIFRGSGNLTATCTNNPGICADVILPMHLESWYTGSSSILFNELTVHFSEPLTDASRFKVVIDPGALRDRSGNWVSLDETCASWVPLGAEDALPDICDGSFTFWTPS